jgi:hypothetical protein
VFPENYLPFKNVFHISLSQLSMHFPPVAGNKKGALCYIRIRGTPIPGKTM